MKFSQKEEVLLQMRLLITYSHKNHQSAQAVAKTLHPILLKSYFKAEQVRLNYKEDFIALDILSTQNGPTDSRVTLTVAHHQLFLLLNECLQDNTEAIRNYQKLLLSYSGIEFATQK